MTDATAPADASLEGSNAHPDADTVLVSTTGKPRLHLPGAEDGGETTRPRCSVGGDFRAKSLAVYPPAHRTWCRYCLDAWRAREDDAARAGSDATVEGSS
ncbi:hypothetical protein EFA46_010615 (plasmid) [Halarchaeum sp. CBA1220]|uniref:hypothetical protein n=1 Tax=Halarchaeum sp. CBA1220 TaxID=1853682 RepID=UPI000F3AA590|nr:hypothetical protein [Halarchaeum sp. CBA1220]QLC34713.1 hypothetical protein EFA46_010615 [Halarchaeum sp. CBA1220]